MRERREETQRERERDFVVLFIYTFIGFFLIYALTRDQTHNLGVLG